MVSKLETIFYKTRIWPKFICIINYCGKLIIRILTIRHLHLSVIIIVNIDYYMNNYTKCAFSFNCLVKIYYELYY